MNDKFYITWEQFDKLADMIAGQYKNQDLQRIVGLSRGGLVLGVTLSNRLNVPFIPLEWQTRDGKVKDVNKLLMIKGVYDMDKVLFVDDLLDSGKTIDQIKGYIPNSRWATLADKKGEVEYTTIEMFNDDRWIIFPWE